MSLDPLIPPTAEECPCCRQFVPARHVAEHERNCGPVQCDECDQWMTPVHRRETSVDPSGTNQWEWEECSRCGALIEEGRGRMQSDDDPIRQIAGEALETIQTLRAEVKALEAENRLLRAAAERREKEVTTVLDRLTEAKFAVVTLLLLLVVLVAVAA